MDRPQEPPAPRPAAADPPAPPASPPPAPGPRAPPAAPPRAAGPQARGPAGAAARAPFRRRSRVVAWAKVLLPLAALGLLSTVFLLAREPGGPVDIPYARLEEIAREPRMDRARLAGVAPDGTSVALSAARVAALDGTPGGFALESPRLETAGEDGAATVNAGAGEVDVPRRTLRLTGGVSIETSAGLLVRTPALAADLATGTLTAGAVTATGPLGEVEAGGLTLEQGGEGAARLVFNRGVRVLYHPRPAPPEAR